MPVSISAALIVATGQSGCRSRSSAAAPEICGVAIEVPDIDSQPPGTDERMETPGALMSGLRRSETAVGPALENPAMVDWPAAFGLVTAATVIAPTAVPGEATEPRP